MNRMPYILQSTVYIIMGVGMEYLLKSTLEIVRLIHNSGHSFIHYAISNLNTLLKYFPGEDLSTVSLYRQIDNVNILSALEKMFDIEILSDYCMYLKTTAFC